MVTKREGVNALLATCVRLVKNFLAKPQPIIKGNINKKGKKIYHLPEGRYYNQTKAVTWFHSEDEAIAAGYQKSSK